MAPARVRGCARPGYPQSAGGPPGKPMPAAGETAHVRRLLVDRSRCGLEVSPAPPGDRCPPGREKGSSGDSAANPSAGGCGVEDQVGRAGAASDLGPKGVPAWTSSSRAGVPRCRSVSAGMPRPSWARSRRLDSKAIRVDVEVSAERNPRQADRRERVELTIRSRGPVIRAEAAADDRYAALDRALPSWRHGCGGRGTGARRQARRSAADRARAPRPRARRRTGRR